MEEILLNRKCVGGCVKKSERKLTQASISPRRFTTVEYAALKSTRKLKPERSRQVGRVRVWLLISEFTVAGCESTPMRSISIKPQAVDRWKPHKGQSLYTGVSRYTRHRCILSLYTSRNRETLCRWKSVNVSRKKWKMKCVKVSRKIDLEKIL